MSNKGGEVGKSEEIANKYYEALGKKDLKNVKAFLHPQVTFTDPQESVSGKDNVLEAAESFSKIFTSLKIRSTFGKEGEAVVIYDVAIPGMKGALKASSHLAIKDGLIASIELFYDMSDIEKTFS